LQEAVFPGDKTEKDFLAPNPQPDLPGLV